MIMKMSLENKMSKKKSSVQNENHDEQIYNMPTTNEKIKNFSNLLDSITRIEDKKKGLWKEIYENCIVDRENAFLMFTKLLVMVTEDAASHAIHGTTIAKYLERMNKANDQLLKLAELLQDAERSSQGIDADDIYAELSRK